MNAAAIIAALLVFILWMRLVGNPHVVETVIGLVIAAFVWFWVRLWFKKKET